MNHLEEEASPKVKAPILADVSARLEFVDAAALNALRVRGAFVYNGEIKPNDVLFKPAGWCVLEAPLKW